MREAVGSSRVTRRTFLATAATATALAAGGKIVGNNSGILLEVAKAATSPSGQDEWLRSYCRMCVKPLCATMVHVVDGVAVEIKGDPAAPTNEGTLCPRGHATLFSHYNPYRVKTPLKRTNPNKGLDQDPRWVEISWEEALNTIAKRLQKVRAEDPRKIVLHTGYGSNPDYYNDVLTIWMTTFGASQWNIVPSNGPLCSNHHAMWMTAGNTSNAPEFAFCNYLITLGGSLVDWGNSSGPVRGFFKAIERGMKLVVVDPRASKETTVGEWVPIRPGSELAFALGMLNVMLYEVGLEKLDLDFLKRRSNAPYLVGAGERFYRDPKTKKPMIWDPTDHRAKVFDDPSIKDFALEGQFQVGGQTVSPAFALIKQGMQPYTPEWSEKLTTIRAATLRRVAKDFVAAAQVGSTIKLEGVEFPLRPAAFFCRRAGEGHTDGHYTQIARILINGLVGSLDVPGGLQGQNWGPNMLKPNEDGLVTPILAAAGYPFVYPSDDVMLGTFYPHRHNTPFLAWRAILDPKKYGLPYEVDTLIIFGANPIINNGPSQEPIAAMKKIPFVVSIAYHLDEPTEFADIVLPESSNLEREMKAVVNGFDKGHWAEYQPSGMLYRYPVVKRMYDSKQVEDIFFELARRLNMLAPMNERLNTALKLKPELALQPDKAYTVSELLDRDLKSQFGNDRGAEYFKKAGYSIRMVGPKTIYNYAYWPMGKTRYHLYFEHMKEVGDNLRANLEKNNITVPGWDTQDLMEHYRPVPHWRPMPIHKEPPEYDMYIINWKTAFSVYGLGANQENPVLYEIMRKTDPYSLSILINPAAAAKRGIQDGDTIVVESRRGKMVGKAKLSGRLHPEVIGIGGNYGRKSMHLNPIAREGPNYNQLLTTEDGTFDPISTAMIISAKVKVYRAS